MVEVPDPQLAEVSEPFGEHIGRHALCYRCHMIFHCRFRSPAVFRAYATAVAEGFCSPPLLTRDIGAIRSQLAGKFRAGRYRDPPVVPNVFTLVLRRENPAARSRDSARVAVDGQWCARSLTWSRDCFCNAIAHPNSHSAR